MRGEEQATDRTARSRLPSPSKSPVRALVGMVLITVLYWILWRVHPRGLGFGDVKFSGLTGLHGAHVFVGLLLITFANIRAWRGHFGPAAKDHLGVEIPGIYWHFVDVMWIVVFVTIYIL